MVTSGNGPVLVASYSNANPLVWTFQTLNDQQIFFGVTGNTTPPNSNFGSLFSATFAAPGLYNLAAISGTSIFLPFIGGNDAPLPSMSPLNPIVNGSSVQVNLQLSDLSSPFSNLRIDWGDGYVDETTISGTQPTLTHNYAKVCLVSLRSMCA